MELASLLILGLALGVLGLIAVLRQERTKSRSGSVSIPRLDDNARQHPKAWQRVFGRLGQTNFEIGGEIVLENRSETDQGQALSVGEAWAPVTSKLADEPVPRVFDPGLKPATPHHELPGGYGDNRIVALVRDPYWLFAYWEVNEAKRKEIRETFGQTAWDEASQVVRVYDVTHINFNGLNAVNYYDIRVGPFTGSWHIPVGQPNRTFLIERGLVLKSGQYVPLARSNFVTTPADQVSNIIDEEWMLISELDRRLYRRLGQLPFGSSPHFAFSQLIEQEAAKLAFGVSSPQTSRETSGHESHTSRGYSESHLESGVISKRDFMKIMTQGLLPESSDLAIPDMDQQKTVGISWGGLGVQEKATFAAEYTSMTTHSEVGENSLTIEPHMNPEMLLATLRDSESAHLETMEKSRKSG